MPRSNYTQSLCIDFSPTYSNSFKWPPTIKIHDPPPALGILSLEICGAGEFFMRDFVISHLSNNPN